MRLASLDRDYSDIHLVEIDLLRRGRRPGLEVEDPPLDTDYVVLVSRTQGAAIRVSDIWAIGINEPLPTIPVPLREPDPDAALELQNILGLIYGEYAYALQVDYSQPILPPSLRPSTQGWLDRQINLPPTNFNGQK